MKQIRMYARTGKITINFASPIKKTIFGSKTSLWPGLSVGWWVGWPVCHYFLKGREVLLQCSNRSNFFTYPFYKRQQKNYHESFLYVVFFQNLSFCNWLIIWINANISRIYFCLTKKSLFLITIPKVSCHPFIFTTIVSQKGDLKTRKIENKTQSTKKVNNSNK